MTRTTLLPLVIGLASFSTAHARQLGPCADGGWGHIDPNGVNIHVRADGSDTGGDGSAEHPFASIEQALKITRTLPAAQRHIAVGPGQFSTHLLLDRSTDAGLVIQGCGADSVLVGSSQTPVVDIATSGAVSLAGFALTGGQGALTVRNGSATIDSVGISQSAGIGLVVSGSGTSAELSDVTVSDTQGGGCGWGASFTDATVRWSGGGVVNATGLGIYADNADISLTDVDVADTSTLADGTLGRGLHAQYSSVEINGGSWPGNHDTSIFLLDPRDSLISNVIIIFPGAGVIIIFPGAGFVSTGDGIVVKSTDGSSSVDVFDNTILGAPRAGILIDGAEVTMSGNQADGTGLYDTWGSHFYAQHGADVSGPDSVMTLSGASVLAIGTDPLTCAQ